MRIPAILMFIYDKLNLSGLKDIRHLEYNRDNVVFDNKGHKYRIRIESAERKELYLNRMAGEPYEVHLDIRVNGDDLNDAVDSVKEYLDDHAEEVFKPIFRKE